MTAASSRFSRLWRPLSGGRVRRARRGRQSAWACSRHSSLLHCQLAGPLRHVPASRVLGLLRGLRPIPCLRPTTGLSRPSSWPLEGGTDTKRFPCSTRNRLISLAPSFAPAASPQLRRSPSSWPSRRHAKPATKSAAPTQPRNGRALHPGPYPPDLSRRLAYGALTTGSCRIPSDLARRTQPVWQYQAVPALSALLPPLPVVSRIRLRSASIGLLRQPDEKVFHLLQLRAPHGAPLQQLPAAGGSVTVDGGGDPRAGRPPNGRIHPLRMVP